MVGEQRAKDRTEFDQLRPVLVRAGQSADFNAENDPDMVEPNFGKQPMEAMPSLSRGAGMALVLVDHLDTVGWPTHFDGEIGQPRTGVPLTLYDPGPAEASIVGHKKTPSGSDDELAVSPASGCRSRPPLERFVPSPDEVALWLFIGSLLWLWRKDLSSHHLR